jgi:probable HAF family extracellular repeat protein
MLRQCAICEVLRDKPGSRECRVTQNVYAGRSLPNASPRVAIERLRRGRAGIDIEGLKIRLGRDFGSLASGISSSGKVVVGSTWDSNFDWSHAFIWQNGVMTDLNTLLPASSNLYATMGNKINERGQISGMATALTGPDAGNIHAFLATPVNASIGRSIADVARTHPRSVLPAQVGDRLVHRFGPSQFGR